MRTSVRRLEIPDEEHGARVDEVLARLLGTSVRRVKMLCEQGRVRRNGRVIRKGERVTTGDEFEVHEPDPSAEPIPDIPYAAVTDALVVVDKPAALPSHRLRVEDPPTALEAVVARYPEVATAGPDPREGGLLHRLDVGTSGLLAFARTPSTYEAGRDAFKHARAHKLYLALVHGRLEGRGTVDLPIAHHPSDPRRAVVVTHPRMLYREQPRPARTAYVTLAQGAEHTLVLVDAVGGRRHQVRVHLTHLGTPLVGDLLYGGPAWELPGHGLHACWLSIPMPRPEDGVAVALPAPAAWRDAVRARLGDAGVAALERVDAGPPAAWD